MGLVDPANHAVFVGCDLSQETRDYHALDGVVGNICQARRLPDNGAGAAEAAPLRGAPQLEFDRNV